VHPFLFGIPLTSGAPFAAFDDATATVIALLLYSPTTMFSLLILPAETSPRAEESRPLDHRFSE